MSIELRLPQITSTTEQGQLQQIKSYLYQLTEQLNWALSSVETQKASSIVAVASGSSKSTQGNQSTETAQNTFDKVKGLIIKSADIVDSYYDEISKRLEGEYEAISDFGTFKEKVEATFETTPKSTNIRFSDTQYIDANGYDINYTMIHSADAWVKLGILEYENGFPVYGMEIGQTNRETNEDGTAKEVFNCFARYTSKGVSLYDNNGNEVAWINNRTLHITNAEITSSLRLGRYMADLTDGIAFKWIGGA